MYKEELEQKIKDMKDELNRILETESIDSVRILDMSKELDKLLNKYAAL